MTQFELTIVLVIGILLLALFIETVAYFTLTDWINEISEKILVGFIIFNLIGVVSVFILGILNSIWGWF